MYKNVSHRKNIPSSKKKSGVVKLLSPIVNCTFLLSTYLVYVIIVFILPKLYVSIKPTFSRPRIWLIPSLKNVEENHMLHMFYHFRFDPDRFSPDAPKRHPNAYQPFGFSGKRKCPGFRFTYYEGVIFLISIFRNFNVSLVPGQDVVMQHRLLCQPKEEIYINVTARQWVTIITKSVYEPFWNILRILISLSLGWMGI